MQKVKVKVSPLRSYYEAAGKALEAYETNVARAEQSRQVATDDYHNRKREFTIARLQDINKQFSADKAAAAERYQKELNSIRDKFAEEVHELKKPRARDLDEDVLKLLNSGIVFGADEIEEMANGYANAGNSTMLRYLDDYCAKNHIGRDATDKFGFGGFESLRCYKGESETMRNFDSFIREMKTATGDSLFRMHGAVFDWRMEESYAKIADGDGIRWEEVPATDEGETFAELVKEASGISAKNVYENAKEVAENAPEPPEDDFVRGMKGRKPE